MVLCGRPRLPVLIFPIAAFLWAAAIGGLSAAGAEEPVYFVHNFPDATRRPFVESVFPPVLQRGTVSRVTFSGYGLETAEGVWASVPGVTVTGKVVGPTSDTSTVMEIAVPSEAPLGLYGLRLASRSGLSNAHIFLIDELPVTVHEFDANPGDSPPSAAEREDRSVAVSLPACIAAHCRAAGVDRYFIDAAAGERVSFDLVGNRFGKDYDPLLTIRDGAGRVVKQCDNSPGLYFDCRFEHQFESAGRYSVEVRDARYLGNVYWGYVLRMGSFPAARVASPSSVSGGSAVEVQLPELGGIAARASIPKVGRGDLFGEIRTSEHSLGSWVNLTLDSAPNVLENAKNSAEAPTRVVLPANLHGVLSEPGEEDWYEFELRRGETISFRGVARELASGADLELALIEPSGREAVRVDDHTNRTDDAFFTFTARTEGMYRLMVRDVTGLGGPAWAYRIEARGATPQLSVTADVARITAPQGNWQPIPLKVTRTNFAGPVHLELSGAPAGVKLEPDVISADQTEAVCRLIVDETAPLGLSSIQILARGVLPANASPPEAANQSAGAVNANDAANGAGNSTEVVCVVRTQPLIDRLLRNKDQQVFALREDQRRLPPSLADRLAVQIVPAVPFDVTAPGELVVLPKYQTADFEIVTERRNGFEAPIHFHATGGQIGDEAEERNNIFCRIPDAHAGEASVTGRFFTRIRMQYETFRVDLSATARDGDRYVTLFRTFEVEARSAFTGTFEPAVVEVLPGQTATFRAVVERTPTWDGAVQFHQLQPQFGIELPEVIEAAAGQSSVTVEVKVSPELPPRRYQLRFRTTGTVEKYEETLNGPVLQIDVKTPPAP